MRIVSATTSLSKTASRDAGDPDVERPSEPRKRILMQPELTCNSIRRYRLKRTRDHFDDICTTYRDAAWKTGGLGRKYREHDSGAPDLAVPGAGQDPGPGPAPGDPVEFLLGSRYCRRPIASPMPPGRCSEARRRDGRRVQAICDYVHDRLTFSYPDARSTRRRLGRASGRSGRVPRLRPSRRSRYCRCMNIPARYCTGYLGDIGVPPVPDPMDFSAWFQVFLGRRLAYVRRTAQQKKQSAGS